MNLLYKLQSISFLAISNRYHSHQFLGTLRRFGGTTRRMSKSDNNSIVSRQDVETPKKEQRECLLDIGPLYKGKILKRPAKPDTSSPYIAKVKLLESGEEVLAWAPALDVGGLCVPGSTVWLSKKIKNDKTKSTISSHAIELVEIHEPECRTDEIDTKSGPYCLVGASPTLGEKLAYEVLSRGLLESEIGFGSAKIGIRTKSKSPKKMKRGREWECGVERNDKDHIYDNSKTDSDQVIMYKQQTCNESRVDAVLENKSDDKLHRCLIEIKNVVCADYSGSETTASKKKETLGKKWKKYIFLSKLSPEVKYRRCGLFPIGIKNQKFEGKKVVSERAIKHIRNLASSVDGQTSAVLIFVLNRSDCVMLRPCDEACEVFAQELSRAKEKGVKAVAFRVKWESSGRVYFDGLVPVEESLVN